MNSQGPPFYGKFRGVVSHNTDPSQRGRIRANVQGLFDKEPCGWAMPSVPYAGNGVGFLMLPPVKASVWIEFEQGDPSRPIWTGCFWEEGEQAPVTPAIPEMKVIKTEVGTITLNDTQGAGGITIETGNGMKIVIDPQQMKIDNGQNGVITLQGQRVLVNDGALEVT